MVILKAVDPSPSTRSWPSSLSCKKPRIFFSFTSGVAFYFEGESRKRVERGPSSPVTDREWKVYWQSESLEQMKARITGSQGKEKPVVSGWKKNRSLLYCSLPVTLWSLHTLVVNFVNLVFFCHFMPILVSIGRSLAITGISQCFSKSIKVGHCRSNSATFGQIWQLSVKIGHCWSKLITVSQSRPFLVKIGHCQSK